MKPTELFITIIVFIFLIGIIHGILYTYFSSKVGVSAFPMTDNSYMISIINVGEKQNNVYISISRLYESECSDLLNVSFSGCSLTQNSKLQYFLKCSEFPSKAIVNVICSPYGEAIVSYESDLTSIQNNFNCYKERCNVTLNFTEIHWGNLIIKHAIPIPFTS